MLLDENMRIFPVMETTSHIFTVSELNATIRQMLEGTFPFISVQGEISNLRTPYSGHSYFTLKDDKAQIKSVLFKLQKRYLSEPLSDGKQVLCRGRLSVYEPRGDYQLIVDSLTFQGEGNLQLTFERLKKRLSEEGLFAASCKKPIPKSPEHITLITSPKGAAVHDFINIATRRSPAIHLLVFPVSVQGTQAPGEIIEAIRTVNKEITTDVIVLCRGGGSIEDLWAFNNEQLARAIRESNIPVVNAVGHEIDFTIADFAADMRAPTPSGAAELLIPDGNAQKRQLDDIRKRIEQNMLSRLSEYSYRLRHCEQQLGKMTYPLESHLLRLGHITMQLERGLANLIQNKEQLLSRILGRINARNPQTLLALHQQQILNNRQRLQQAIQTILQQKEQAMARTTSLLDGVSPLATLARGYAIVRKHDPPHSIITDAQHVSYGEDLDIHLHKGVIRASVLSQTEKD